MTYRYDWSGRLHAARRIFTLVPLIVFLTTLILFSTPSAPATPLLYLFMQVVLRALVASLTSILVCVAAYRFYRYLLERSPGL